MSVFRVCSVSFLLFIGLQQILGRILQEFTARNLKLFCKDSCIRLRTESWLFWGYPVLMFTNSLENWINFFPLGSIMSGWILYLKRFHIAGVLWISLELGLVCCRIFVIFQVVILAMTLILIPVSSLPSGTEKETRDALAHIF